MDKRQPNSSKTACLLLVIKLVTVLLSSVRWPVALENLYWEALVMLFWKLQC